MAKSDKKCPRAVVIGVSTGGVSALKYLLGALPHNFSIPVIVVSHIAPGSDDGLPLLLNSLCAIQVKEADELDVLTSGMVYIAPANYHLQIERGGILSLSVDPPVNFARPSVDALFETAATAYGSALVGIILTGAGSDGSKGLLRISQRGGTTIVQDPDDAEMNSMPKSALQLVAADYTLPLRDIPGLLMRLVQVRT